MESVEPAWSPVNEPAWSPVKDKMPNIINHKDQEVRAVTPVTQVRARTRLFKTLKHQIFVSCLMYNALSFSL